MGNSSARDTRRAARAEKDARALDLRKQGATFQQIAVACGYANRAAAYKAVNNACLAITREPAASVVKLELSRLDRLLLAVWPKASKGDARAVDSALRILERRSCYLGLDAPKRSTQDVDAVVHQGAREELLARIATLAAGAGASRVG